MELQQNLNLITLILKQTVGLQQIRKGRFLSLISKGSDKPFFPDFWRYDNIALNERLALHAWILHAYNVFKLPASKG